MTANLIDEQNIAIWELMQMLPHLTPFLLIDKVVACEPGKSIRGYKNVTRIDSAGVSPGVSEDWGGMPVMLVLEALAQLSVVLARKTLAQVSGGEMIFFFAGIDDARFGEAVRPGDRLELESSVVRILPTHGVGKITTCATVGGRLVAKAIMMAMPARGFAAGSLS